MTSSTKAVRLRRQIVSGVLALALPACTSWQVGTPTPADYVSTKHPDLVRVTRTDGSRFDLRSPKVEGDSLVGLVGGGFAPGDSTRYSSVLLSDVQSVESQHAETGATLALIGGVMFAVGIIAVASGCGDSNSYGGC